MKLLLALDLRSNPEAVIAKAVPWAERLGAVLDLLFVDDTPDASLFVGDPAVRGIVIEERARLIETHRARLAELAQKLPSAIQGKAEVVPGIAPDVVVERASGYDAVFVATHGRTGLNHFWMGSVAEKVVRLCPVPVLTLRLPEPG